MNKKSIWHLRSGKFSNEKERSGEVESEVGKRL